MKRPAARKDKLFAACRKALNREGAEAQRKAMERRKSLFFRNSLRLRASAV
jgi:hypothetical protein